MANERRSGLRFWDRLILFTAWVVTCGLVYLLGFYVGKGTQIGRLGLEERVVRLPVTSAPPHEGQRPKSDGELTFYDTLVAGQTAGRRAGEPAAPAKGAATSAHEDAPATSAKVTTPHENGAAAPAKGAATTAHVEEPARAKSAATTAHGDGRPAPAAAPRPATGKSAPPPARAGSPKPPSAPVAAPASPRPAPQVEAHVPPPAPPLPARFEPSAGGGWTVLANPTRNRGEAEALETQLRGRGYDATVVQVLRDGDTWYRLRVGRYPSADQATAAMRKLREHEGVEHAFVASE